MNRLQERRMELGLTQVEVSQALRKADPRMDVSMVSRFENGVCIPPAHVLGALETVLQADIRELLGVDVLAEDEAEPRGDRAESPEIARVLDSIPYGRRNAVGRRELAARLGMDDRKMRRLIEEARLGGAIIINDSSGRGYYQTDDLAEMARQYRQDTSRAMAILKRRKPLRDRLKAAGRPV